VQKNLASTPDGGQPRRSWWGTFDWTTPFTALLALVLAVLVLLPIFWLLVTSLSDPEGGVTLRHYLQVFRDPAFVRPFLLSLWTSAATGALCVLFAAPMGWLVARTNLPGKRLFRTLILASFVTPPFLGAFAWTLLGGPNAGLINQWYYKIFGLTAFSATPLVNIYTAWGLVFVLFLYTFPYVFTLVANGLDYIPSELEEASAILGAPVWRTALQITFPLVVPALLAGFIVAFLNAITLFGTPAILALPAGLNTLTTQIWSLFQFPPRYALAAASSLPLLLLTVVLLRTQSAIMGRRGYSIVGGKSGGQRLIRLGWWKLPAVLIFVFVLSCSVILPYGALLKTAFVKTWSGPLSGSNLTLEHWRFVFFEFSQTQLAFKNTFILGGLTATVGTVLITIIGYITLRKLVWGHKSLSFLATAPIALPGIVLGVGLFLSYTKEPLVLYGTLAIIFLAYLTKELPVGFQQINASLKTVHPELEDASRILGANRLRALWDITTPLVRNGVVATWLFFFIGSIRELSATIILFTARTKTISVTIFDLRESNDWGAIAVLSITLLVITFLVILLINVLTRQKSREGAVT